MTLLLLARLLAVRSVCECVLAQLLRLLELARELTAKLSAIKIADLRKLGLELVADLARPRVLTAVHTCPSLRQPPTRHPNDGIADKIFVWVYTQVYG